MILFLSILFLILSGDNKFGHLLPAAFKLALDAGWAALATAGAAFRSINPASLLQVSAHVDVKPAAIRNCRLPMIF
jgi:hypothetical protein